MSAKRNVRVLRAGLSHGMGAIVSAAALAAVIAWPALGQDDVVGRWDPPEGGYDWEVRAEHAVHLSTGKILVWPNGNNAKLWDPGNGGFTDVPNEDHNLGCSGHTALANGSILAAGGGGEEPGTASEKTSVFSLGPVPLSGPWQAVDPMFFPRWYPTCTALPDGKVLAIGGSDAPLSQGGEFIPIPEVYDPGADLWYFPALVIQPDDTWKLYPRMFLLPDGTVFFAGPGVPTWTFDLTDTWTFVGDSHFGGGADSAVTYEPGKVLKCGGTAGGDRTDVINLNQLIPAWVEVEQMEQVRRRHNLVMLPDGKILAIGGEQWDEAMQTWVPVFPAEWFDPDPLFETWQPLAVMTRPRAKHSTAVLLPDGRVLACGGADDFPGEFTSKSGEIFSPPYLFWGERPVIGLAPTVIRYGTSFRVVLSAPAAPPPIGTVSLVRLGAVTHHFDQNQRYVPLTFTMAFENALEVDAPANANLAPPGYYMLFVVSQDGVPSVATYVRLE